MASILVLGSLNIDLVQRVEHIPLPGETVIGTSFAMFNGGKGNNQASAAARLGKTVKMFGKLGNDVFGKQLIEGLRELKVDVSGIDFVNKPSGVATVIVAKNGENLIVVSSGANSDVDAETAQKLAREVKSGDFLLCQLEIPVHTVTLAMTAARARGVTTILDPAPYQCIPPELLQTVDIFTPNQTEAAQILQSSTPVGLANAEEAVRALQALGPQKVILKMGASGCFVANGSHTSHFPGHVVKDVVDTTGAGDCFNGALAAGLIELSDFESAVRYANAAAALSVTKNGAVDSMPTRAALQTYLRTH